MSELGWRRETRKVACSCMIDRDTPEDICSYTLPPDVDCLICHGAGFFTERYRAKLIAYIPKDEHGRPQWDQAYAPDGSPHLL